MLIEEVAQYIHNKGIGIYDPDGTTGDIYIGSYPDTPADIVSVFLRGGGDPDPDNEYTTASVQVMVRSGDNLAGMQRGQSIVRALNGFCQSSLIDGGIYVIDCLATQGEPEGIGKDDADRNEWSINFSIEYKS